MNQGLRERSVFLTEKTQFSCDHRRVTRNENGHLSLLNVRVKKFHPIGHRFIFDIIPIHGISVLYRCGSAI
jgi:hypothetical protein